MRAISSIIAEHQQRQRDALTFVGLDLNCRIYRDWLQLAKHHYRNSTNPSVPRELRASNESVMWIQLFRHEVLRSPA